MHLKLMLPEATHIMCAYDIPGKESHYVHDYCDGGDYGVAKHILRLLINNKISSRAIFVVRFSKNGVKLGSKRIEYAVKAAKMAIDAHPYNYLCKTTQVIKKGVQP